MANRTRTSHFFRACIPAVLAAAALAAPVRAQGNIDPKEVAKTVTMEELTRLVGGPTLVSLHFKDAAPKAVFEALARQAKVDILAPVFKAQSQELLPPISVDMERQPFWPAMRALCGRVGLNITAYRVGPDLNPTYDLEPIGADGFSRGPVSSHGLVLFVADSSRQSRSLSYSSPRADVPSRQLNLLLLADPKLRLLDGIPALQLDTATDEKGRVVFEPQAPGLVLGGDYGLLSRVSFSSDAGPPDSRRLAEVRGTAKLFVGFHVERWAVPDILRARDAVKTVPRPAGVSRYVVRGVVRTGLDYEVRLAISRREFELQNKSVRDTHLEERVHLSDARGREYTQELFGTRVDDTADPVLLTVPFIRDQPGVDEGAGGPRESATEIPAGPGRPQTEKIVSRDGPGRPQSLVIEILDVRAVEVPFEFKDLPLP